MKIYDISMVIEKGMAVYKNKSAKKPKLKVLRTLKNGANESKIMIDNHTGTHADAYFHMLAKGKTIDKIKVKRFVGDCIVLDFTDVKDVITKNEFLKKKITNKIKKNDIVLLKTKDKSLKKFVKNFTYLEKSGAEFLAKKGVKAVGIDNLGIERDQPSHDTHKILFKRGILVYEGLELSKIKPKRYFFVGMPLKIKRGDAAPVRAVLIEK